MIINANARTIPLADESVHCVITSPPYYGLRDYGTAEWVGGDVECDHAVRIDPHIESSTLGGGKETTGHQKEGYKDICRRCGARRVDDQLGLEATPEEYIAKMVAVFREVRRVMRPDATLWLNIGDSYATHASASKEYPHNFRSAEVAAANGIGVLDKPTAKAMGMKEKDLIGIPWMLAFALRADGWWLRSDIIWSKPNPMPESVTDRPTKAHEYLFLLSKSATYYYDQEAIREPVQQSSIARLDRAVSNHHKNIDGAPGQPPHSMSQSRPPKRYEKATTPSYFEGGDSLVAPFDAIAGRNKRTVWEITTENFNGSHFATFPQALVKPCLLAGSSDKGVCPRCGMPWERVVDKKYLSPIVLTGTEEGRYEKGRNRNVTRMGDGVDVTTLGWRAACSCDAGDPVPAVILDPFAGSGTVGLVAKNYGRRFVGLDLKLDYCRMATRRIGEDVLQMRLGL